MKEFKTCVLLSLLLFALPLCAQTVKVNWRTGAPFASYKTFAWQDSNNPGAAFYGQWLKADVVAELGSKGLTPVAGGQTPYVIATYHLQGQELIDTTSNTDSDGFGWGAGSWGGGACVREPIPTSSRAVLPKIRWNSPWLAIIAALQTMVPRARPTETRRANRSAPCFAQSIPRRVGTGAHSYRSASTGSSFAAFMAGQTPKIRPMLMLMVIPAAAAHSGTTPGQFSRMRIRSTSRNTKTSARRPPAPVRVIASSKNCQVMSLLLAPMALRTPISRVRSVTLTSMMFMTPTPPISSPMELSATITTYTISMIL